MIMVLFQKPFVLLFYPLLLLLDQQQQWFVSAVELRNSIHHHPGINENAVGFFDDATMERRVLQVEADEGCVGPELRSGEFLHRNEFLCISSSFGSVYKFGIQNNGFFGEWAIDKNTGVEFLLWTISDTSNQGEKVTVDPETGFVLLFDINNNIIWSSDCYALGARLIINGFNGVVGHAAGDQTFWFTSKTDGECRPPIYCKGNVLRRGDRLLRNEYLCPTEWSPLFARSQLIFGLSNKGQLGHFQSPPRDDVLLLDFYTQSGIQADRLVFQKADGNLVLYSEDNTPLWSSTKKCSGWTLERRASAAVVLLERDGETLVRYFNTDGEISDCFPNLPLVLFDLPLPSTSSNPRCRLSFVDHRNEVYTLVQVEKVDTFRYKLTASMDDNYCGTQQNTRYLNILPSTGTIVADKKNGSSLYPCPEFAEPMPSSLGFDLILDKRRTCSSFGKMLMFCAVVNGDFYD